MEPLTLLKEQVAYYLKKASTDEKKKIQLSSNELKMLKSNFCQLRYEIRHGELDEVYHTLVDDEAHQEGVFRQRELQNILNILQTMKAAI